MADAGGYVHYENPFVTPPELRQPARQLRGRLAAPVTVWTAGPPDGRAGLTVSSVIVAEGDPSLVCGLINDTTELWDALTGSGRFVVSILSEGAHNIADLFAGRRPSPGGPFSEVPIEDTQWGPVLVDAVARAFCRLERTTQAGYQQLVMGEIERIDVADLERPLVYFRGRYEGLRDR
jgi:3-hydroxy-9,10-secoandrosta-1,3,5(10)-triene-9,17-dione monooxygenase reductase component